jgi:hypothetical protein
MSDDGWIVNPVAGGMKSEGSEDKEYCEHGALRKLSAVMSM